MANVISKLFGDKHTRDIKRIEPIIEEINRIFESLSGLTDDQLKDKSAQFRSKLRDATKDVRKEVEEKTAQLTADASEEEGSEAESATEMLRQEITDLEKEEDEIIARVLDEILPEAFAVVKETCRRLVGKSWKVCDQEITWEMVPFDVSDEEEVKAGKEAITHEIDTEEYNEGDLEELLDSFDGSSEAAPSPKSPPASAAPAEAVSCT